MAHALALVLRHNHAATPREALRALLVWFCGLALIGAGPFFPGVAW